MTEKQVVKFDVTEAAIAEMTELYGGLVITDLGDQEQYDIVHDAHMIVRGKRTAVDKKRKELKADALAWGKKVQSEANRIFALIEPLESHLKAEKQKVKDEQERLEQERIDGIKTEIASWKYAYTGFNGTATVEGMREFISKLEAIVVTPDLYFEFTTEASDTIGELITRTNADILTRERLDKEESDRKAEADRLAKVKAEQDRIAAEQKAEQDRLDAIQKRIDDEKKKVAFEKSVMRESTLKNINIFRAGIAGESLVSDSPDFIYQGKTLLWNDVAALSDTDFDSFVADIDEQLMSHKNKVKQAAKIKAEADAKAAAEQAEKDRLANEKKRKEEEIRKAALLPDRDKLVEFSLFLAEEITYPNVEDSAAKEIVQSAWHVINDLAESILKDAENL